MCVNDVTVALLQELYVSHSRVSGLHEWRVHVREAEPARAAVVVTGASVESLGASECTNVYGGFVCVRLKRNFGELYVVSVYCRYGRDIDPYLSYMERVLDFVCGQHVVFDTNSNATFVVQQGWWL